MPLPIDTSTEFGQRVEQRLDSEQVVWLTTASPSGTPQPSMVWFLRDGDDILVMSQPNTPKVRAIRANPRVALNFNGTESGGNMVVLNGTATLEDHMPEDAVPAAYFEKYGDGITSLGMTPGSFIASYSQPIRIRLDKVRGF